MGARKTLKDLCKRGYSCSKSISETYVNQVINRNVYQRRMECDLKVVPYNLQMIMDWDSDINVEYSGSAYCALYLHKYCYKSAARKEHIDLGSEQQQDSLDEIIVLTWQNHVFYGGSLADVWISGLSCARTASLCI
jgi:hypothetical protein